MGFDLFGNLNNAIQAPEVEKIQLQSLHNARTDQQQQYGQNQGYYSPYYDQGTAAMRSLYGNVQNGAYNVNVTPQDMAADPGFQFRMAQGQQALERSAAARGGLMGGGFAKDLAGYSQGLASQEYGNIWNRKFQQNQFNYNSLANLAGMGERAAGNLAGLGERFGNTMAGYDMAKGNINSAALMGMTGGAAGFADGATGMGFAAATGSMGGMGGMGGGGGMSAGNPYSMQPLGGGYGGGGYGGGQSIGAIPTQGYSGPMASGGYAGYGSADPLGGYGDGGPYSMIPPQYGGGY